MFYALIKWIPIPLSVFALLLAYIPRLLHFGFVDLPDQNTIFLTNNYVFVLCTALIGIIPIAFGAMLGKTIPHVWRRLIYGICVIASGYAAYEIFSYNNIFIKINQRAELHEYPLALVSALAIPFCLGIYLGTKSEVLFAPAPTSTPEALEQLWGTLPVFLAAISFSCFSGISLSTRVSPAVGGVDTDCRVIELSSASSACKTAMAGFAQDSPCVTVLRSEKNQYLIAFDRSERVVRRVVPSGCTVPFDQESEWVVENASKDWKLNGY